MRRFVIPAILFLLVSTVRAAEPASFRNDAMAVLSKAGCNAGACHGNKSGKGGLKLSLRGQDPEDDYAVLTRDFLARRVDTVDPDASPETASRRSAPGVARKVSTASTTYATPCRRQRAAWLVAP